jgi:hypothetical protein
VGTSDQPREPGRVLERDETIGFGEARWRVGGSNAEDVHRSGRQCAGLALGMTVPAQKIWPIAMPRLCGSTLCIKPRVKASMPSCTWSTLQNPFAPAGDTSVAR